jgi:hypothetical protein
MSLSSGRSLGGGYTKAISPVPRMLINSKYAENGKKEMSTVIEMM